VAPLVVAVIEPGVEVTVYPVIAEPPLNVGATHDTTACRPTLLTVAVAVVGAPGTVYGVTEAEAAEAPLVPTAFVAVTVNV
jgi:hypothetical protein